MTREDIIRKNREINKKSEVIALEFVISIIKRQLIQLNDKDADSYCRNLLEYFENYRSELNDENKWSVSTRVFISAYNVVSNYYDAQSSLLSHDAEPHQRYYHASVGQLKDELWRLAGNA
jgi:hypothetical protein